MEKAKHSVQFEAEVDAHGNVTFSRSVHELHVKAGEKVTVNIFGGVMSKQLTKLNVTEKEIEKIGNIQFEDRQHVMTFLSSQGSMSSNKGFTQRMKRAVS